MVRLSRSLSLAALALVLLPHAAAQEIRGAEAALKEVDQARKTKGTGDKNALRTQLQTFQRTAKTLTPSQAAKGWLSLYDQAGRSTNNIRVSLQEVGAALPSPDSWKEIAAGLRARAKSESGLGKESSELLAARLLNDIPAERKSLDAIIAKPKSGIMMEFGTSFLDLDLIFAKETGDQARLIRTLTRQAAIAGDNRRGQLNVPDLVGYLGPQIAERTLTNLLVTAKRPLTFTEGAKTKALAQRLALTNVKRLKVPQWSLVEPRNGAKLYEALIARFGAPKQANSPFDDFGQAHSNYAVALYQDGRRAEALKIVRSVGQQEAYRLANALGDLLGTPAMTQFLAEAVGENPSSPLWDTYLASAYRSQDAAQVVPRLQKLLTKPNLSAPRRAILQTRLQTAFFAADRIDEGLVLQKKLANDRTITPAEQLSYAIAYARSGKLLERPAVVEEALAIIHRVREANKGNSETNPFSQDQMVDLLLDLGRNQEAETVAIQNYTESVRNQDGRGYDYGRMSNPSLLQLANLYFRLNRPEDVRYLLDHSKDWGVKDIVDLLASSRYLSDGQQAPVGYVFAWALAKTGAQPQAEKLILKVIQDQAGFDPAYSLLYEIEGAAIVPRLDALYAADQFEERPLIWKAVALKDQGKLEEAEATIRKAIAVDPSDGETHGGHRMYAYTVLSEILAARGDAAGAAEYRSAVAAIRLAERADQFAESGMIDRAIKGYIESTRLFSDAYCIQSRLAVDLMEQGRTKEAEEHYRRAYELMPSSFGRVETHCMGCERVFEGQIAQNIAERVFTSLAQKTPNKPQVHYLLGYLRYEQGRFAEAMASYRKAVALDPEYLNAWKQMLDLADETNATPTERRTIAAALSHLDPLQKRTRSVGRTADLANLWRQVDKALAAYATDDTPGQIYPLAAAAESLKSLPGDMDDMLSSYALGLDEHPVTAGAAVSMDTIVQNCLSAIEARRSTGSQSEDIYVK